MNTGRCKQCGALMVAILAALFTGFAYAGNGPAADIGAEVWLGLFATVLFSLLAGYSRGQDRRIAGLEFDAKQQQSQLNMLSERVLREHPSRIETDQHRAYIETQLEGIRSALTDLRDRLPR